MPRPPDGLIIIDPTLTGLSQAGNEFPGAKVTKGPKHPLLNQLALGHAQYQAQVCRQGHQNFQKRYEQVAAAGLGGAAEICAESWPWQKDATMKELGLEMFKCWKQSSGHWSVARATHRWWGGGMAMGRNGVWYSCILVAD